MRVCVVRLSAQAERACSQRNDIPREEDARPAGEYVKRQFGRKIYSESKYVRSGEHFRVRECNQKLTIVLRQTLEAEDEVRDANDQECPVQRVPQLVFKLL